MSLIELAEKERVSTPGEEIQNHLPHVIIEPRRLLGRDNLLELWRYRELFYFLTWRDVKVRYKQTALGATWAILQPLFNMLLFTLIFGRLAKLPSDNIPYPLFALAGLLPWTFFANAVSAAGSSLVGNSHLVTKVYFPRLIIPAASVLAVLVDFGFAFGLMAVLMAVYRVPLTINLLLLPYLVLVTVGFAFAVGTYLAALQVKYRDVRYVIPFLIQFWMFATPIIYPVSMLPQQLRPLFALNPMAGVIEAYRVALLGGVNQSAFGWTSLLLAGIITLTALLYSAYSFRRMEKMFADVI